MRELDALLTAVDQMADQLRAMPQSRLRQGAAARGLELARELAVRAQKLEFPEREPRVMPDAGVFAVGDQLAVAGHDLVEALRAAPGAEEELAEARALIAAGGLRGRR